MSTDSSGEPVPCPATSSSAAIAHMLNGLRLILNQERVDVGPVHWVIRTSDRGDTFNVRGKRGH